MSYLIENSQHHLYAIGGGWISSQSPFYYPQRLKKNAALKLKIRLIDKDSSLKLRVVDEVDVYKGRSAL